MGALLRVLGSLLLIAGGIVVFLGVRRLPEALPAELGFPAQGLLGNQGIGTDGPGVDLIIHKVMQFEHVHRADGYHPFKCLSGPTVVQNSLPGAMQAGLFKELFYFFFFCAVEHRRGHMDTFLVITGKFFQFRLRHLVDRL